MIIPIDRNYNSNTLSIEWDDDPYIVEEIKLKTTFTFVRINPNIHFPKGINRLDKSYWMDILIVSKNNALPPVVELAEHLSLSVRRTYLLIQRLRKCNMLQKKNRIWFANPMYGFHGKRLSPELFSLFRNDLSIHLPRWVVEKYLGDLGE